MKAVITADIVNSTKLSQDSERQLFSQLKLILKPYKFELFRGDSFQVYVEEARDALAVALSCRALAIRLPSPEEKPVSDIRVSIGIGNVIAPVEALATAKGEAFLLSGRSFDGMVKTGSRIQISISEPLANLTMEVISDYLDSIYLNLTTKQAEVIFELLNGHTQQEIAEKLGRSKSTVNQHVASGRWEEIERLIGQYKRVLEIGR